MMLLPPAIERIALVPDECMQALGRVALIAVRPEIEDLAGEAFLEAFEARAIQRVQGLPAANLVASSR